eukprot:scaffold8.g1427.t1
MGRLQLKRAASEERRATEGEQPPSNKRLAALQPLPQPQLQAAPAAAPAAETRRAGAKQWVASLSAEIDAGAASADIAPPAAASCATGECTARLILGPPIDADGAMLTPELENAEQGLRQIVQSMRCQVDEGRVQLAALQRLHAQKQSLLAKGRAVLQHHCQTTWLPEAARAAAAVPAADSPRVVSLHAECRHGTWELQARVSLPARLAAAVRADAGAASLVAASAACALACGKQHGAVGCGDGSGGGAELTLAASLEVEPSQREQLGGGDASWCSDGPWVDVFALLPTPAASGASSAKPGSSPLHCGRVQLRWAEWVQSHVARSAPAAADEASCEPSDSRQPWRHARSLAVETEAACLPHLLPELFLRLGFAPRGAAAAASQRLFQLGPASAPMASLQLRLHGEHFAEVDLGADSWGLLQELERQLRRGVDEGAAAAARGAAPGTAGVPPPPSLRTGAAAVGATTLGAQAAAQQAEAADALVQELDACVAWVEALLRERLALDRQMAGLPPAQPPAPRAARAAQQRALIAMAATDCRLAGLLT